MITGETERRERCREERRGKRRKGGNYARSKVKELWRGRSNEERRGQRGEEMYEPE